MHVRLPGGPWVYYTNLYRYTTAIDRSIAIPLIGTKTYQPPLCSCVPTVDHVAPCHGQEQLPVLHLLDWLQHIT